MEVRRPLSALSDVPWSTLSEGAGVPAALQALQGKDAGERAAALEKLWDALDHHGLGRSTTTLQAIPFLIDLLAESTTPDRPAIARLLAELAVGDTCWYLHEGFHPDLQVRPDACARSQSVVIGSNPAQPDEQRRTFPSPGKGPDMTPGHDLREIYAAVAAGLPVYLDALQTDDALLRQALPFLLAWLTPASGETSPHLTRLMVSDSEPTVRASASLGLSHAIKRDGVNRAAGMAAIAKALADAKTDLEQRCASLALIRLEEPAASRTARDRLCKDLNAGVPPVAPAGFVWSRIDSPPFLFCTALLGTSKAARDEVLRAGRAALRQLSDPHESADLAGWMIRLLVPLPSKDRMPTWGTLPDDARTTLVSVVACEAAWHFSDVRDLLKERKLPDNRIGLDSFVR